MKGFPEIEEEKDKNCLENILHKLEEFIGKYEKSPCKKQFIKARDQLRIAKRDLGGEGDSIHRIMVDSMKRYIQKNYGLKEQSKPPSRKGCKRPDAIYKLGDGRWVVIEAETNMRSLKKWGKGDNFQRLRRFSDKTKQPIDLIFLVITIDKPATICNLDKRMSEGGFHCLELWQFETIGSVCFRRETIGKTGPNRIEVEPRPCTVPLGEHFYLRDLDP